MMPPSPEGETFRAGVGMIVVDLDGRVLALERSDILGAWQLPQGGLHPGEAIEVAAWRELAEETGLSPEQVTLEDAFEAWVGYELPEEYRKQKTGRGQVHRWFLFRLQAGAKLPELPKNAEFHDWQWLAMPEVISRAVEFRRPEYRVVARWLNDRALG
jgi:putative (di)nucleoside polyphosphate hydrolase